MDKFGERGIMSFDTTEIKNRLDEIERQVFDLVSNQTNTDTEGLYLDKYIPPSKMEEVIAEHLPPVRKFYTAWLSDTSVRVLSGVITRNGTRVVLSETDLSGLTAGPYYITVTLSNAGSPDPTLIPATVAVTKETSVTVGAYGRNVTFVIAKVTCTASIISAIEHWYVGDIDDTCVLPDANSDSQGSPWSRSISFNPNAGVHQKETELWGFANGAEFGSVPDDLDFLVMRDADRAAADGPDIIYVNAANLADWLEGDIDGTALNPQPHHTKLQFNLNDGHSDNKEANQDHDWRYPILGNLAADVFFRQIGRVAIANTKTLAAPVLAIDLANMRLHDAAGTYTADWLFRKLHRGGGAEHVNWEVVDGTRFLISDDTTAVNTIGSNALQVVGSGFFGKGAFAFADGAAHAGQFYAGNIGTPGGIWALLATPGGPAGQFNDGTRAVNICDGTYALNAGVGAINAQAGYYADTTPGVTIGSWVKLGIVISESAFNAALESKIISILNDMGVT